MLPGPTDIIKTELSSLGFGISVELYETERLAANENEVAEDDATLH
jgi:hypothetical protein